MIPLLRRSSQDDLRAEVRELHQLTESTLQLAALAEKAGLPSTAQHHLNRAVALEEEYLHKQAVLAAL